MVLDATDSRTLFHPVNNPDMCPLGVLLYLNSILHYAQFSRPFNFCLEPKSMPFLFLSK